MLFILPRTISGTPEEIEKHIEEQRRLFYVALTRCKCSDDYEGTLIISSFTGLPGNEALQLRIPASHNAWRTVRASRFISEFGESSPEPISLKR